jgi:hypothetical protein
MTEGRTVPAVDIDREALVARGVVPAAATLGAMAVGFGLVAGVLIARESLILAAPWTKALALAMMYVFPQFVVGLWMGVRHGVTPGPAIAAGLAPIVVLMLALFAFGGPALSPLEVPLVTLGAIVVWGGTCAGGLLVGDRVLAPRLEARRS